MFSVFSVICAFLSLVTSEIVFTKYGDIEGLGMLLKRGMGNGEWGMGNGEWGMGNGEWGMGNGE